VTHMKIHLNWGTCADWRAVREQLLFLKTPLRGNFADLDLDVDVKSIKRKLGDRGFKVEIEAGDVLVLRLSDA
jgi:hypothetical protein